MISGPALPSDNALVGRDFRSRNGRGRCIGRGGCLGCGFHAVLLEQGVNGLPDVGIPGGFPVDLDIRTGGLPLSICFTFGEGTDVVGTYLVQLPAGQNIGTVPLKGTAAHGTEDDIASSLMMSMISIQYSTLILTASTAPSADTKKEAIL